MRMHVYGLINCLTDSLLLRLQTCLAMFRCVLGHSAQPFCRVRGRSGERSPWALRHSQFLPCDFSGARRSLVPGRSGAPALGVTDSRLSPASIVSTLRRSAIGWPPIPHSAVPALGDLRLNRHLATPTLAPFGARLHSAVRRLVLRHCGSRPRRSPTALVLSCSGPRPLWSSVAPSMLLCMLL